MQHDRSSNCQQPTTRPCPKPDESSPRLPNPLKSIWILYSHRRLDLPPRSFPPHFPITVLHSFLFSPIHATCTANLILLDAINLIISGYQCTLWSHSLCAFLQSSVPPTRLGTSKYQSSPLLTKSMRWINWLLLNTALDWTWTENVGSKINS